MANDLAKRYAQQTGGKAVANTGRTGGFAGSTPKTINEGTKYVKPSGLPGVIQKVSDVGGQLFDVAGAGAKKTGSYVKNAAVDIYQAGRGAAKTYVDAQTQPIMNKMLAESSQKISDAQTKIITEYRAGRMTKENYLKSVEDLNKAYNSINEEAKKISSGPTPQQRAMDVTETAVNVLSMGSVKLAQVGAKQAYKAGGTEALEALIREAATPLEKAAMKVPAVQALIQRNLSNAGMREAKKVAGENIAQYIAREGRDIAVNLLIKRPIFYQSNIAGGQDVYDHILAGNYPGALKSSAWLATQMISGGPLGAAARGASWIKNKTMKLAYGKGSFIDEISKQIGNGNPSQIARLLTTMEKRAPNEFKSAEKTLRIMQETNLRAANDDLGLAVDNVLTHYAQNEIPLNSVTPGQLIRDMDNWVKADELAQATIKAGKIADVSPEDAAKYVVVRWDSATKQALSDVVAKAGNKAGQRAAVMELADRPGVGWGNNEILMKKINAIIARSKNADEAAQEIRNITTASTYVKGIPNKVSKQLDKLGFTIARPSSIGGRRTPIVTYGETRKLISGAIDGNTQIFDPSVAPQPIINAIAGGLKRSGLSPEASGQVASRKLGESVVASLDEAGMAGQIGIKKGKDSVNGGRAIISTLQNYVEGKRAALGLGKNSAVTDVRQLTIGEVEEALKVTKSEARAISSAIIEGYTRTPLEYRGLGDKIVDTLYSINPLQKYYSRIQSAFRYTYNPFFRAQERVETKVLTHVKAANLIWMKPKSALDDAARVLDEGGIFTSSLPGEAANDQVLGRITANITQGQKRDLAGLALDMAEARGLTLKEMVSEHSDEIDDALRVVVQYPTKGVLASPLARTMNLMFFPMRYNIKVTGIAAEVLSKQPPSVQLAVIHSGFKMREWLKSDEGIQWQSDHADAIQVLSWITPVNSIQYSMNLLLNGKPDSISELGQLGGLPLGFISQMLDSQGIIKLNKPYIQPKTGDVMPDYIPVTTRARAAVALQDMIGSMFTYPGRTLGLPGKKDTIRKAVDAFIDTNGPDFDRQFREEDLTPLQKNWVRVLKGDDSDEAIDALYQSPADGQFNWYTIPPIDLPKTVAPTTKTSYKKRDGLPSSKRSGPRQKKTALPIPQRQ